MTEETFDRLFLEHIGELHDFPSVSGTDIANNEQKLKEVCTKAEKLKTKLVHQYQKDNEECKEDEELLENIEKKRRKKEVEEEKERELAEKDLPIPKENGTSTLTPTAVVVVPNVPTDNIMYPNTFDLQKPIVPQKPDSLLIPDARGILVQIWKKEKPDRETKLAEIINEFATDYQSTKS